jgi:hypothetical protein
LIPFDFKFEVYDYNNKCFSNSIDFYLKGYQEYIKDKNSKSIKINKIKPNIIPLHFQVILPNYTYKGNVEFSTSASNYFKIKNNTVPKNFKDNFYFDLDLYIDDNIIQINNLTRRKKLSESNFILKLKLNNKISEITLNFKLYEKLIEKEKYKNENISKFKLEKCLIINGKEKWEQVEIKNNNNKADLNGIHVSMYGLEQLFNIDYFSYEKNDNYKSKQCLYIPASENHLLVIKFNTKFLIWGTKINYEIINNLEYYTYDNISNIGIIGFIGKSPDLWFPAFYRYDDYFNQLNVNGSEIKYKDILKEIISIYEYYVENSFVVGTYSILAYKIAKLGSDWKYEDKIKHLKNLLNEIAKILNDNNIIEQIKKLEKLEKDSERYEQTIYRIYVNTIYLLYSLFKKRYQFIKICSYNIIFSCLSKEKLNKKSEELLNKYFSYDSSKSLDKQYILNSFKINKEISISKEMYKKLPSTQNKAIIYKEGTNSLLSDKITADFSLSKSSLNKGEDQANISTFKTETIPKIIYPSEWSIFSLNDFFIKSIKGTRELPLFAISAKLENDTDGLNQTEKLYIQLLDLFENSPEVDDSLIGELIMTFNDQFTKMTNNLLNSNIIFNSKKWKKHSSNENKKFYEHVIMNENIEKIFSQKYMTIFNIFLNNQRNIKVGDADFYLSPKIMMFDTFLLDIKNKYKIDDTSLYIQKIKEVVKDY